MEKSLPKKSGNGWHQGNVMGEIEDLIAALSPVAATLEKHSIPWFVGGTVATSFHGASRSTMDVDLVAELPVELVEELLNELGDEYYGSHQAAKEAVNRVSCFNLIHLPTSFKVDLFISRRRPFDREAMSRATKGTIGDGDGLTVRITTAEDAIIAKLEWYRLGNEQSQRQWQDVTRVLSLLGEQADWAYPKSATRSVGVADLLQRLEKQQS